MARFSGCTFTFNIASRGGALCIANNNRKIVIENSVFAYNKASVVTEEREGLQKKVTQSGVSIGGAISLEYAKVYVFGTVFKQNAAFNGGALAIIYGGAHLYECWLINNTAGYDGGAILTGIAVVLILEDTHFTNNSALDRGSAIYAMLNVSLNMANCMFQKQIGKTLLHLTTNNTLVARNCMFVGKPIGTCAAHIVTIDASFSSLMIISSNFVQCYIKLINCTFDAYNVTFQDNFSSKCAFNSIQHFGISNLNFTKCIFLNITFESDSITDICCSIIALGGDGGGSLLITDSFVSGITNLGFVYTTGNISIRLEGVVFINNRGGHLLHASMPFSVIANNLTVENNTLEIATSLFMIIGNKFIFTNSIVQQNIGGSEGIFAHILDGNFTIFNSIFYNNSARASGGVRRMVDFLI